MKKIVVYTAIFGGKDSLQEPAFDSPEVDYVCFTESDMASEKWKIVKTEVQGSDPVRFARKHKILAHTLFPDHEYSVWVDGNILVRGDMSKLVEHALRKANMAVYDHAHTKLDPRSSVFEEAKVLVAMAGQGKYKDDPALIEAQMERYRSDDFPDKEGLLSSMELVRRHNAPDVVQAMEAWWQELERGSRRDQLSFNYAAWKTGLSYEVIHEDSRDNEFFLYTSHAKKDYFDSK